MNITEIMRALNFSDSDIACILDAEKKCGEDLRKIVCEYYGGEIEYKPSVDKVSETVAGGVHTYTAHMLYALYCAEVLYKKYKEKNLPDELFINSMMDLKYKLDECRNVHNECGTFVARWFGGFFEMYRFAHGRLQYDLVEFKEEDYISGDIKVKKGEMVLNCHIPSAGPLTKELVIDSLKRAYEFNKDLPMIKKCGVMPVVCCSWLLYPEYKKVFSEKSNLRMFMDMFDVTRSVESETFGDAWRVFGKDSEKSPEELPQNTSLQRGFAKWIKEEGRFGEGVGILLFDGEKLISHN